MLKDVISKRLLAVSHNLCRFEKTFYGNFSSFVAFLAMCIAHGAGGTGASKTGLKRKVFKCSEKGFFYPKCNDSFAFTLRTASNMTPRKLTASSRRPPIIQN